LLSRNYVLNIVATSVDLIFPYGWPPLFPLSPAYAKANP
jgi:hypothetical protein